MGCGMCVGSGVFRVGAYVCAHRSVPGAVSLGRGETRGVVWRERWLKRGRGRKREHDCEFYLKTG